MMHLPSDIYVQHSRACVNYWCTFRRQPSGKQRLFRWTLMDCSIVAL